ncbi:MAG TPA: GntR family transcriptional regulator [Acidimicrobiia bacterium]
MKASLAIAAEIRGQIARGELAAGAPLPVESELTERLGVSKGTVREALRILETEGLVEVRRGVGGGPRVRHPSISEAASSMALYMQIGDVPVIDVFETRDRMVASAVECLAQRRFQIGVLALEAEVDKLAALVGDFDAYYPQLIEVEETAVRFGGTMTEQVLVSALRHIVAEELEAATRAIPDVDLAVAAEEQITASWVETCRLVREGDAAGARVSCTRQAEFSRSGLAMMLPPATVVDMVSSGSSARAARVDLRTDPLPLVAAARASGTGTLPGSWRTR